MRQRFDAGARLVVKVGSSSLVSPDGQLEEAAVDRVAAQVAEVWRRGHPTVLVTSGAVAAGFPALALGRPPADGPSKQAAAAVGQVRLMHRYAQALADHGLVGGQILLTRDVLGARDQYLNARQAFERMMSAGIVPIVNENDTVAVDEMRLGDNDRLAAIVSHLIGASLLVILTDTEGLFSSDPRQGEADFLHAVDHADAILDGLAGAGPLGSGGVAAKVTAARLAAWSQIPTVIAAASVDLAEVTEGRQVGTWVSPRPEPLSARKLWIAFCQRVVGTVTVDDGAAAALVHAGSSLLPVGVTGVSGSFAIGAAVDVREMTGRLVGRGIVRMDSVALSGRIGKRGGEEAIHRDDLVVFDT